jgi:putative ABC transport system ATP-binding protein
MVFHSLTNGSALTGQLGTQSQAVAIQRPTIVLEKVSKIYRLPEGSFQALYDIDLTITQGEYCAIMGPSGCGKSTTMNILGCLDRPTSGHYWLEGIEVETLSDADLARVRNREIGFVFQQFYLLPSLTAVENVMLPLAYAGVKESERRQRATLALEQVGLASRLHQRPSQLSGGQQQRVAIARAIVNHPTLLLADEPTGALDSHTSADILKIFAELHQQGMTLIVVTHSAEVGEQAGRLIRFSDGRIVAS